ncbi:MAG TPA: gas vesicle protein GvpN [Oscillatoriaceae cyanobacterium M33_DOE_052]|uniref:Gas vesicle protein GvpN n=1 Tax=Planktothricoides sp. SpSt-374 TaxID=2282167 RepID=A0A7C3ZT97_9CYAN|nr:gas vesicle protein GvpN [Oscillatoriaceae cyanobacterium M33_DOE_052]
MTTVLRASPRGFVNTPQVAQTAARALRYLQSGFSVHLRGPAGTGKTTLALHLADLLERPMMLIFGDSELKSGDLIGRSAGYTRKKVVDNFIHNVVKVEDELRHNWVDSRLTLACKEGFTLVYDEFNRSRPEVNNVLLSALEEKLLVLPPHNGQKSEYVRVHPNFRAIFTSNPEEYSGVHDTQDALMDRLVTINMPEPDGVTQLEILMQKTGIDRTQGLKIVQLVRDFRERTMALLAANGNGHLQASNLSSRNAVSLLHFSSTLRSCITIAKVCREHAIPVDVANEEFRDIFADVVLSRSNLNLVTARKILAEILATEKEPSQPQPENGKDTAFIPYEEEVLAYIKQSQGVRVSEIQAALNINRVEAIDALRSLIKKGMLMQRDDRLYIAQKQLQASPPTATPDSSS